MNAFRVRPAGLSALGVIVFIAAAGAALLRAQAPRPMGIVDLLNLPRLTDPQISPDSTVVSRYS